MPVVTNPAELSINRVVNAPGVPFQLAVGKKRTKSVVFSKNGDASADVVGRLNQPEPLLYCQLPCAAVAALPTIAIPASRLAVDPPDTVSVVSVKRVLKRVATESPTGAVVSSSTPVRVVVAVVRVGASLTGVMVMAMVLVSCSAPPVPVFPWSLMVMTSDCSLPGSTVLTFPVGVNLSVAKAILMFALVPVNTILGWLTPPVPTEKTKPVVVLSVNKPLGDAPRSSVTCSIEPKSSVSVKEIPVTELLVVSSLTVRVAGAVRAGASLVPEMLMLKVFITVLLTFTPVTSTPLPSPVPLILSSSTVVMTIVLLELGKAGV